MLSDFLLVRLSEYLDGVFVYLPGEGNSFTVSKAPNYALRLIYGWLYQYNKHLAFEHYPDIVLILFYLGFVY